MLSNKRRDVKKFVKFYESEFGKNILEKGAEYIYNELKNCQKILDVGCGIGSFEQKLENLNIIGLDNSEEMLNEARKRSNKTFVLGNAENLNFSDSSFDAVFFVTTLEFLNDYQKPIQEASRVTKPKGKLLVMMLNPESEYFKEHVQRKGSYFRKVKHTNLMEIKDDILKFYNLTSKKYSLGVKERKIFDTFDKKLAALYVIIGIKPSKG